MTKNEFKKKVKAEDLANLPISVEHSVAFVFDEFAQYATLSQRLEITQEGLQNTSAIGLYLFVFCLAPALVFWDKSLLENVIQVVMVSPDMDAVTAYYLGWAVVIGLIVIDLCIGVSLFLVEQEKAIDHSKSQILAWGKMIGFCFAMLIPLVKIGEQVAVFEADAFSLGSAIATGAIAFISGLVHLFLVFVMPKSSIAYYFLEIKAARLSSKISKSEKRIRQGLIKTWESYQQWYKMNDNSVVNTTPFSLKAKLVLNELAGANLYHLESKYVPNLQSLELWEIFFPKKISIEDDISPNEPTVNGQSNENPFHNNSVVFGNSL